MSQNPEINIFESVQKEFNKRRQETKQKDFVWEDFKANRKQEVKEELIIAKHIKKGRKRQLDIYSYFLNEKD